MASSVTAVGHLTVVGNVDKRIILRYLAKMLA